MFIFFKFNTVYESLMTLIKEEDLSRTKSVGLFQGWFRDLSVYTTWDGHSLK